MKFSKGLLNDKDIMKKIYDSSVDKSKSMLKDIFGIDFEENDSRIKEIFQNDDEFKVDFEFNGRDITGELEFGEEGDSAISQLVIKETVEKVVDFEKVNDYNHAVNLAMNFLEDNYELEFTPLDPQDKDEQIQDVREDGKTYEVSFKRDYHEGSFVTKLSYEGERASLLITENKRNSIYLD